MPKRTKVKGTKEEVASDGIVTGSGRKKQSKKKGASQSAKMTEVLDDFKFSVEDTINKILGNTNGESYTFPGWLTNDQRKYIHDRCRHYGLKSKSHGKEPNRCIEISLVRKQNTKEFVLEKNTVILDFINNALEKYNETLNSPSRYLSKRTSSGAIYSRLYTESKVVVPKVKPNELTPFRESLPVYAKKTEFLELLNTNQVLIISSETGSGKTTQIPQFILEQASETNEKVKVVCTQPRRLSTIAVAERVAAERGEEIGHTVGYQIKLETKAGPNSALIYCTNGVLLRTFMSHDNVMFNKVTHIIIDEVHERDKSTDILLISIRERLKYNPRLKLILMSATINTEMFTSYFNNAQTLHITGRNYDIQHYFLDDLLPKNKEEIENSKECFKYFPSQDYDREEMDAVINRCIEAKQENDGEQLLQLILSEDANINHRTAEGFTPLMAAVSCKHSELIAVLIRLGVDFELLPNDSEFNALASELGVCSDKLTAHPSEEQRLLSADGEHNFLRINFNLVIDIILSIRSQDTLGTILVFLPGYDDIITCMQKLAMTESLDENAVKIICLHSSIPTNIRRTLFQSFNGKQKIILSTNIAETSITIPDVVYVIDTGLAKETSYDAIDDVCILRKTYISKASVAQRAGRAGRTQNGASYHLISRQSYCSLPEDRIPEILRVPLYELCLQSKLLAFDNMKISEFLNLALDSPSQLAIDHAVDGLIALGALDERQNLTLLGKQLLQLSVEPRLGKMLIYSVILKCLDPVLTVVACLSQKEMFCLPPNPGERALAAKMQKSLAGDSLSDHYVLIKAFQLWQEYKVRSISDISDYYISNAAMESISLTRNQLMSQLRAIGLVDAKTNTNSMTDLNVNSNSWAVVKAALAVGCYPNLAFMNGTAIITKTKSKVRFNAVSALSGTFATNCCIIYEELTKVSAVHTIRCGTVVTPLTIALMCGEVNENSTEDSILLDDWLEFRHSYNDIIRFRLAISSIISKKVAYPCHVFNTTENDILKTLTTILIKEDENYNLVSPTNVGLRPKILSSNMYSDYSNTNVTRRRVPSHNFRIHNSDSVANSWRHRPDPNQSNGDGYYRKTASNKCLLNGSASRFFPQSTDVGCTPEHAHRATLPTAQLTATSETTSLSFSELLNQGLVENLNEASYDNSNNRTYFGEQESWVFFLIKTTSQNNFKIALTTSKWNFHPQIKKKLFRFSRQNNTIILFFTIINTNQFQGCAKLTGISKNNYASSIEWLSLCPISYNVIENMHLLNSYSNNRPIHYCNDGEEIAPDPGHRLYDLFITGGRNN